MFGSSLSRRERDRPFVTPVDVAIVEVLDDLPSGDHQGGCEKEQLELSLLRSGENCH